MIETLQAEQSVQLHAAPKLLVEWSSPWREFATSIRPAMARSQARLAGEAPYGMLPFRGMVPSMLLEAFLVAAAIVIPVRIRQMRPYVAPSFSRHDVIYYTGDELPRTEDLGGAQAGFRGQSGGSEAHHPTQTIRIARGGSLLPQVVDAPNLKLPTSHDAVANLLAIKPDPGPPPAEGLRSKRTILTFPAPVVAPAPEVIHDYTRNGVHLDTVIAPAPASPRDPFRTAPNLSAAIVSPAPSVANEHALVAPALGSAVILPAPRVSRDRLQNSPSVQASVVAPAPNVSQNGSRPAPSLAANVIAPAPTNISHEISSAPVQMTNAVVPPPVSAPERSSMRDPKLTLPANSVIAPPPSADISQDMRRLASGQPDPGKSVVAPPPTVQSGGGSFMSSLIGKIFGPSEVVPPPPSVQSSVNNTSGTSLAGNVVPPPPTVATSKGGNPNGRRGATGSSLGSNVIAPPPTEGMSGGSGNRPRSASSAPALGLPGVVPPPPSLAGSGTGSGEIVGGTGTPGGTLLANNVVPPPPSAGSGGNTAGSGLGRKAPGLGSAMDVGAPLTAPSNSGSGGNAGVVASSQPGSKVGLPLTGGKGSLAISPSGGDKTGIGGNGGGGGIARGSGPGSGLSGEGSGAAKAGSGRGSDPTAHGGISSAHGPGGAGDAPNGNPRVPGVMVQGGSSIVTLPSFGSDPATDDPSAPAHSSLKQRQELGVTIVASAGSGGAFEPYKDQFHGETYTTYLNTSLGVVVMEFSDGRSGPIVPPSGIRLDLPDAIPHSRIVIACTLDASGNLINLKMLEPVPAGVTAKIVAALRNWKLQPATRGDQPVAVTAVLGFGINTDDRF